MEALPRLLSGVNQSLAMAQAQHQGIPITDDAPGDDNAEIDLSARELPKRKKKIIHLEPTAEYVVGESHVMSVPLTSAHSALTSYSMQSLH